MGLINAINCNKEDYGLGIVDCEQFFGEPNMPILVRKGWSMTKTAFEALTADDFVELVQTGVWIPIPGAKQFTMDIPDPTTEEYSGGVISVVRNGKPRLQFDFDKGVGFHKALYSKNAFSQYDLMITDDSGQLMFAEDASRTKVVGLSAGMVNTRTYAFKSGDTSANTMFEVQLTNEEQFNRRMAIYSVDQSNIDFNELLKPITSVTITGTAEAGDPIVVQVNAVSNTNYGIEALTAPNFRVVNNLTNAVVPITSVAVGTIAGQYLLTPTTPTTAGQVLRVELYDADVPVAVALVGDNNLYKGGTLAPYITVASIIVVGVFTDVFSTIFA